MADAFGDAWRVVKRRWERTPSNIMMRQLDPDKLQELAQRHHDNILQEIEDGTYEHETMINPLWPYGFDEESYMEYIEEGGLTGGGYVDGENGREWVEDGIPHMQLPVPEKHDEGYTVPKVSWGDQWAVQYPNGEWHLVNEEGVGGRMFEGQTHDLDVHLSNHDNEGKKRSFNMLPMKGIKIGIEDIAGLLGTEEKSLEEVIRSSGGHRLESNYSTHKNSMWEGGLGEQMRDPIEDAQEDRSFTPGTLDEDKFGGDYRASADVFNDAWGVVKSGDFFFARKKRGKKIKDDPKGVKRAVRSGHRWANTDNLREVASRARPGEHSTYITPPPHLWDKTAPWSGNENPKHRPWRAINLSKYGMGLPKNPSEVLHPVVERKVMDDMFDRDTHEAMHEALELPLRGWPDAAHEFGAIAAQTSSRPLGREHWSRADRFRRVLETHPDTMGRFDLEGSRRKRRRRR